MIRIIVVIDRDQDLSAVSGLLASQEDFEMAGTGKDSYDALKLSAALKPDIAVIDLPAEDGDKPGLVPMIKRKSPSTAVIILNADDKEDHVCKALSEGASGYVLGPADAGELCSAVRIVHEGGCYITGGILERTFSRLAELTHYRNIYHHFFPSAKKRTIPSCVSRTELKIISYIGQGWSIKEIAESLHLAQGTIRNSISSAMHKMGLRNRAQIALFAIRNGLIDLREQYGLREQSGTGD